MAISGLRNTLILCSSCIMIHLVYRYRRKRRIPLPPSLPGWPIVGNAFQLPMSGLYLFYQELGRNLGSKILHVDVFGNSFIVINDAAIASDLLEKRSSIYSSRPHLPMLDVIGTSAEFFGFLPYVDEWRNQRRMFHQHFSERNLPREEEKALEFARKALLPNLYQTPQDFFDHVAGYVGGVALSMTYGLPVKRRNDPLVHLSEEAINKGLSASAAPGNYWINVMPFLKHIPDWVPGAIFKQDARRFRDNLDRVMDEPYQMVQENLDKGMSSNSFVPSSLDIYKDSPDFKVYEPQIKKVAAQVFGAASETTTAALRTFIFAMLLHPDVQQKAQQEIDSVIGSDSLPDFSHRLQLPYLTAILKEVLRWNPIVPTGIPHLTTADDVYSGYYIPKGSMVFANAYAMLHDEEVFPHPKEFDPDRFIKDGVLVEDILDPAVVATFGFGRRACPGGHIAMSTLYIATASILSVFDISPARDANNNPIEPKREFFSASLVSEPFPFQCEITPRRGKDVEGLLVGNMSLEFI